MRVAVLGAGVVGVATAWYPARAGHSVTVIDRSGLFLNTGHGMLGRTLACATAHDVAAAVGASAPCANEAARAGRASKPAL